ncbi:MAG: hypothetical protein AAF211_16175, partial [Myxococcota bacterium]
LRHLPETPAGLAATALFEGLAGIVRRDPKAVRQAQDALAAVDAPLVGWWPRDTATGVLSAYAHDLEGLPLPVVQLARIAEGCEGAVLGGVALLDHDHVAPGLARLAEADDLCAYHGTHRYLRVLAAHRAAIHYTSAGQPDRAAEARRNVDELWPLAPDRELELP